MVTLISYNEKGDKDVLVFNSMLQARMYMLKEYERVHESYKNTRLGEDYLSYGNEAGLILRENQVRLSLSCTPKDYADKDIGLIISGSYSLIRTKVLSKCIIEWQHILSMVNTTLLPKEVDEKDIDSVLTKYSKTINKIFKLNNV